MVLSIATLGGAELGKPFVQIGHTSWAMSVAVSRDGRFAVSGGSEGALILWDVQKARVVRRFLGHTKKVGSVAFSPDGSRVISGSEDRTIRVWDVSSGKESMRMTGHTHEIMFVAVTPDGREVFSGSKDKTLRVWDAQSSKQLWQFDFDYHDLGGFASTPEGRYVAVSALKQDGEAWKGEILIWDMRKGREYKRIPNGKSYREIAFSPDGKKLLTARGRRGLALVDVETGETIRAFEGYTDFVFGAAFSPDGRYAVSGGRDKTIRLWALKSGREIQRFEGHTVSVQAKNAFQSIADEYILVRALREWQ